MHIQKESGISKNAKIYIVMVEANREKCYLRMQSTAYLMKPDLSTYSQKLTALVVTALFLFPINRIKVADDSLFLYK